VILAKDRETEQRRAMKVIWGETWFLTHQELKKKPVETVLQFYPLVNSHIAMERSTMFNGKIHYFYGHFQ